MEILTGDIGHFQSFIWRPNF